MKEIQSIITLGSGAHVSERPTWEWCEMTEKTTRLVNPIRVGRRDN